MKGETNMKYNGLTKEEHIELLKECGMCTKKWTIAKMKQYDERRREILESKTKNKKKINKIKNIFNIKKARNK